MKRYYYKKDGKAAYNLKEPLENIIEDTNGYEEITEQEWNELTYVEPQEPTEKDLVAKEISKLKANLSKTDYVVLKIAEALMNNDSQLIEELKEEYAEVLENRVLWRARLNELL